MIDLIWLTLVSPAPNGWTGHPKTSLRSFSDGIDRVQGVFQERMDDRIKFHTYVVREHQ